MSVAPTGSDLRDPAGFAGSSPEPATLTRWPLRAYLWVLIALGLGVRLLAARGSFLMPDESWHLNVASAPGLTGVYRSSLETAHPPLFMLLLHFWREVARSEWQLRLLPVVFGVAFLLASYRWIRSIFGEAASLAALALLTFLPALVLLSSELRAYGLLLWLLAASLAALERAFAEKSIGALSLSAVWGGLALLTHYAALWVVISASLYAAVRILSEDFPARFRRAWLAGQAALAGLCLALYVSQVSRLRGGMLERDAQTRWLKSSYFRAGAENPIQFIARQTLSVFTYIFSTPAGGALALVLFLLALAWLVRGRRPAALLLASPFLLNMGAGLLALYPYGGTRHSITLAIFACAGVAMALAKLTGDRLWVPVGLALILAPAGFAAVW